MGQASLGSMDVLRRAAGSMLAAMNYRLTADVALAMPCSAPHHAAFHSGAQLRALSLKQP